MSDSVFVGYNPDALQYLPDLNATFAGLDAETSAKVSQTLYAGLVTGTNPKNLVSSLVDCVSPARAEMIARTEMLGAYRSAALDAYRANSDVVGQWMWSADLIGACISCLEQDGSLHDLDEDINDMTHPSCRCTAVPITASWSDILGPLGIDASGIPETSLAGANFLTGDEWFAAQSAATQREIMGQAAWNAWQQGDLHIVDLVGEDGSVNSLKSLGLDFRDYLDRNMINLDEAATEREIPFATSRATAGIGDVTASYDLTAEDKAFASALKDQITALDQDKLTVSQVSDIGRQLNERIEADLAQYRGWYEEAKAARAVAPNFPTPETRAWFMGDRDELAAHGGLSPFQAAARYQAEYQARVGAYLSEIRDMGGVDVRLDMTAAEADQRVADAVQHMQDNIPRDWLSASNDLGEITPVKNRQLSSGGWFLDDASGNGQIALSYTRQTTDWVSFNSAALHEMMHRMEQSIPQLSNLETDFYMARTAGETAVPLRTGPRQMTKLDRWIDEYLGRSPLSMQRPAYLLANGTYAYATSSYELLSIGAEMLLGGGSTYELIDLRQDEEFVSFILGVFAALEG